MQELDNDISPFEWMETWKGSKGNWPRSTNWTKDQRLKEIKNWPRIKTEELTEINDWWRSKIDQGPRSRTIGFLPWNRLSLAAKIKKRSVVDNLTARYENRKVLRCIIVKRINWPHEDSEDFWTHCHQRINCRITLWFRLNVIKTRNSSLHAISSACPTHNVFSLSKKDRNIQEPRCRMLLQNPFPHGRHIRA
jgi:hypothetical protein